MTKKSSSRSGRESSSKTRRSEIRRVIARRPSSWRESFRRPAFAYALLIALGFTVLAGAMTAWTRAQPSLAPGRVITHTHTVRVDFALEDVAATESARERARRTAPRVYRAITPVFEEIQSTLEGLPTALQDVESVDRVAPEILNAFEITPEQLEAVRAQARDGQASESWRSQVRTLIQNLRSVPIIDADMFQVEHQETNDQIELRWSQDSPVRVLKARAVNVAGDQIEATMRDVVRRAGFRDPAQPMVVDWLVRTVRPTYEYDPRATQEMREAAVALVQPRMNEFPAGHRLATRGDVLSDDVHKLLIAEHEAYWSAASRWAHVALWGGAMAATLLITSALAAYLGLFCAPIARNPLRVLALAILLLGAMAVACWGTTVEPRLFALTAIAPTVFVSVIVVIAYAQRVALAIGAVHAMLVGLAMSFGAEEFVILLVGVGVAVWLLREIRHRNTVIRAGAITGGALAGATLIAAALGKPWVADLWREALFDAGWAAAGGLAIGFITLGILPTIERVFDITTGMTLIELRDPKQPLLRELQQRAPGTYNHSLTVATLAESAADAIGANGLHVYVGALYHDVGKMNKPDYFVENQTPGFNRHAKLSPAMSLLVIVGHVKDGVELAREYNLPRSLIHYIESHHGTTLVEYFYRQASRRAEEEEADAPSEIEYRYPGPKPRTREAAIMMLCDAVESATRAMPDPTPSRIESLVRSLATRRLMDGQFDESELTLRELNTIEDAVIKTLCSIYHARIAYPGAPARESENGERRDAPHPADRPEPAPSATTRA